MYTNVLCIPQPVRTESPACVRGACALQISDGQLPVNSSDKGMYLGL
jgi:hypothetical protein